MIEWKMELKIEKINNKQTNESEYELVMEQQIIETTNTHTHNTHIQTKKSEKGEK